MLFLILLLTISINSFASERTICFATINSSDEKELFKKYTAGQGFKYVELTELSDINYKDSWFDKSCENKNISCDILVVSGHFGGSFFGNSGYSLSTKDLEKKSCENSCDNILKNVKEVFLFGCNTLASKDQDHRTPEEYLEVLLADDIPRPDAERIVEARYGALGQSFKERMQRIFSEVPHIYGFHSVGPSGQNVRPFLKRYFEKNPNYSDRIEKVEAEKMVNQVNQINDAFKTFNNASWASAMNGTAHAQCSGITTADPAYRHKEIICELYDENKNSEEKVNIILDMLTSEDYMLFMPSISSFINERASWDNSLRNELQEHLKTERFKNILDSIIKSFKDSPAMTLDYLAMMNAIGFISDKDLAKKKRSIMLALFQNPSREQVDTLCSIIGEYNIDTKIVKSDLPDGYDFSNPKAVMMTLCLDVQDTDITKESLRAITKTQDPTEIAYLLVGYGRLPGANKEILAILRKYKHKAVKQYQPYVDVAILNKETDESFIINKVKELLQNHEDESLLYEFFEKYSKKSDDLAWSILNVSDSNKISEYLNFVPKLADLKNNELMTKFFMEVKKAENESGFYVDLNFFNNKNTCFGPCKKYLLQELKNNSPDSQIYTALANSKLNENEVNQLIELARKHNNYKAYYRYVLSMQEDFINRQDIKEFIKGPKRYFSCKETGPNQTTCSTTEIE